MSLGSEPSCASTLSRTLSALDSNPEMCRPTLPMSPTGLALLLCLDSGLLMAGFSYVFEFPLRRGS